MEDWWQRRPARRQLESRPHLTDDLEHVLRGYRDLETERPWIALPMSAPIRGDVPWSKRDLWLEKKGVPEEDWETYEILWGVIAEEMDSK